MNGELELVARFGNALNNTQSFFVLLVSSSRIAIDQNRALTIEEGLI